MARFPAEVDLCDPPKTPIYQSIAPRVAAMHERGLSLNAVAKHLGVDDHTAAKALRWFRAR